MGPEKAASLLKQDLLESDIDSWTVVPNKRQYYVQHAEKHLVFIVRAEGKVPNHIVERGSNENPWTLKLTGFRAVSGSDVEQARVTCKQAAVDNLLLTGALHQLPLSPCSHSSFAGKVYRLSGDMGNRGRVYVVQCKAKGNEQVSQCQHTCHELCFPCFSGKAEK